MCGARVLFVFDTVKIHAYRMQENDGGLGISDEKNRSLARQDIPPLIFSVMYQLNVFPFIDKDNL